MNDDTHQTILFVFDLNNDLIDLTDLDARKALRL